MPQSFNPVSLSKIARAIIYIKFHQYSVTELSHQMWKFGQPLTTIWRQSNLSVSSGHAVCTLTCFLQFWKKYRRSKTSNFTIINAVICAPGYGLYLNSNNLYSCRECLAGQVSIWGRDCTDCNTGSYSDKRLSTDCSTCPPGSYSPPYGKQTACTPCEYNSIAPSFGASECSPCQYGFQAFYGVRCVPLEDTHPTLEPVTFPSIITPPPTCGAPTQGPMTEWVQYTEPPTCGAPTQAPTTTACPAGYGESLTAASGCVICDAGSYRGLYDSKYCVKCEIGSYNNKKGSSTCTRCQRNFYTPKEGARSCKPCPRGYESQFGDYCQYVPTFSPTTRPTRGPSKRPRPAPTRRPTKRAPTNYPILLSYTPIKRE